MFNLNNWKEKFQKPQLKNKQTDKMEDITMVRNIHEKLASMQVDQCFAVATREGHKIFKLIKVQPYKPKEINNEN